MTGSDVRPLNGGSCAFVQQVSRERIHTTDQVRPPTPFPPCLAPLLRAACPPSPIPSSLRTSYPSRTTSTSGIYIYIYMQYDP